MSVLGSANQSELARPDAACDESTSINCSIYGLGLQVNVPIAGLAGLPSSSQIDVRMILGAMPTGLAQSVYTSANEYYVSPDLDEHGLPAMRALSLLDGKYHLIAYSDGTNIVVDSTGSCIWATAPPSATVEDTATYLLGPILGFVLRLRGVVCLHASAIVVDGRVVALVGPSGAGKSSTAAAFTRLGYPVLTDDVLALSDHGTHFEVQPAYPRLRLWSDSVNSLFGSADALPLITPNWQKRFLDLNGPGCRFQLSPLPLAAIYSLGERSTAPELPTIEVLSARTALMSLVSDTYMSYLLDSSLQAKEFEVLGRLSACVPVRRAIAHADFDRVSDFCQAIVDDFRAMNASTQAGAVGLQS